MLLRFASQLQEADAASVAALTPAVLAGIVELVPDTWLDADTAAHRAVYLQFLQRRLVAPRLFVEEALGARNALFV